MSESTHVAQGRDEVIHFFHRVVMQSPHSHHSLRLQAERLGKRKSVIVAMPDKNPFLAQILGNLFRCLPIMGKTDRGNTLGKSIQIRDAMNFHLGKMSPQECIDFLVEKVGHERANAEAEVRRSLNGSYPPLYQAAYMLGALQIRQLHKELVDSGKMTNRDFHDAVLHENSIPIELIRADLTKQKLSREFTSSWRFYEKL